MRTALLALSLCAALPAQGQLDELTTNDGKVVTGRVARIDDKGGVHLQESADVEHRYELAELRRIRFANRGKPAAAPGQQQLHLRTGPTLTGKVEAWNDKAVTFVCGFSERSLVVPMRYVRAIRFAAVSAKRDGGFAKYSAKAKEDKDVLSIRKGDRYSQRSGLIQNVSATVVTYEARGKLREVPIKDLYGIVRASNLGAVPDRQARPTVRLALRGGVTLAGKVKIADKKSLTLRLNEGIDVPISWQNIGELRVDSDRLVYLTDLTPIKVEQTAAFDRKWPWLKDRAPAGVGVQLDGKQRSQSLVLIPKTRLTYRLANRFDRFAASIGIEDRSRGPAHAVVRVFAGDKLVFESKPLTRQVKAVQVDVPVTGAERLTIEADFGKNFDFGDHCVFAEARLVKQGK